MIQGPDVMAATEYKQLGGGERLSSIFLNSKYFGDTPTLLDTMSDQQASGFLTKGVADPAEQLLDHELGHALTEQLGIKARGEAFFDVAASDLSTPENVEAISKYATQNRNEFVAEAMANALGPNPTPLASLTQGIFTAAYHKKFG